MVGGMCRLKESQGGFPNYNHGCNMSKAIQNSHGSYRPGLERNVVAQTNTKSPSDPVRRASPEANNSMETTAFPVEATTQSHDSRSLAQRAETAERDSALHEIRAFDNVRGSLTSFLGTIE